MAYFNPILDKTQHFYTLESEPIYSPIIHNNNIFIMSQKCIRNILDTNYFSLITYAEYQNLQLQYQQQQQQQQHHLEPNCLNINGTMIQIFPMNLLWNGNQVKPECIPFYNNIQNIQHQIDVDKIQFDYDYASEYLKFANHLKNVQQQSDYIQKLNQPQIKPNNRVKFCDQLNSTENNDSIYQNVWPNIFDEIMPMEKLI